MIIAKSAASSIGGKTARACDSCVKTRAKWYCAADDAFLCQSCDSTVHSANPLARRHERVRLKTASFKSLDEPSWHRGLKRKARTPRNGKPIPLFKSLNSIIPFVPELGSDEISVEDNNEEEEQQLLYRVPIFDPFVAELCGSSGVSNEPESGASFNPVEVNKDCVVESVHGFMPSDMDLADFAADVESLLGRGLENESFRIEMEELGLVDCKEEEDGDLNCLTKGKVKLEEEEKNEEEKEFDNETDMGKEPPFELSFEYDSATCGEDEEKIKKNGDFEEDTEKKTKRKILLSLDYDAVISTWATQGCPWTNGNRPEIDLDDECLPDWIMGNWGGEVEQGNGRIGGHYSVTAAGGGREARVLRYKEKRRTRLFSKKIRYEVRKLNAEKRPRMKGRFVKRATFAAASLHSK